MSKLILTLLGLALLTAAPGTSAAQAVLSDFEQNNLTWEAVDGTFVGPVQSPDSNRVNGSGFVGEYTKDSTKAFSLLRARLAQPLDLGSALQVAVDVNAGEASSFILKLEGGDGVPAAERTFNIPVANQWRRYVADFSEFSGNDYTTIILFFDNGNETGAGTYYFDNLATEESDCAGTVRDALIIDDFACQRAAIGAGFDSLFVVDNPDPDDLVGAGSVGEFRDSEGGFAALVYQVEDSIDVSAAAAVNLKMWAPVAGELLVKLQDEIGGAGAPEIRVPVTETETWVEYTVDFSEFAGRKFKSLVLFTNVEQDGAGDTYYFDDIQFEEAVAVPAFEDFELAETVLFYTPLMGSAPQNGDFGIVDNPDAGSGGNESARVGRYTAGASGLSTLQALSAEPLDLSATPELSMLVWAPAGSTTVRGSAVNAAGRADVEVPIAATEQWVTVNFNFGELGDGLSSVSSFEFIFDSGTEEAGRIYYIDDLRFGAATSGACDDVEVDASVVDDFECQRNAEVVGGGDRLAVIPNPDMGEGSANRSATVGRYTDPNDEFSALTYEFAEAIDLTTLDRVTVQVWAPKAGPLGLKLEGSGNGAADVEKQVDVTEAESWQTYAIDFGDAAAGQYTRLSVFFNFGVAPGTDTDVYYVDNVGFARGPYTGCVSDFEAAQTSVTNWGGFAGGSTNDTAFAVIDNPDPSGVNTSARVGRFSEASDATETFAGIFAPLGTTIEFPDAANQTIRMSVWAPIATDFVLKLENPLDGGALTGDVEPNEPYTEVGKWQVLTFDYGSKEPNARMYQQLTLIPGFGRIPDETVDIYFDDIVIGDAMCEAVSTKTPRVEINTMRAYPNPVADVATVVLPEGAASLRLIDGLGRTVRTERFNPASASQVRALDVANLPHGTYQVVAQDNTARVLARVSVVVSR